MGGDHGIATGGDPEEQVHRLYKELPRRQGLSIEPFKHREERFMRKFAHRNVDNNRPVGFVLQKTDFRNSSLTITNFINIVDIQIADYADVFLIGLGISEPGGMLVFGRI
jgi:hypothetical protein